VVNSIASRTGLASVDPQFGQAMARGPVPGSGQVTWGGCMSPRGGSLVLFPLVPRAVAAKRSISLRAAAAICVRVIVAIKDPTSLDHTDFDAMSNCGALTMPIRSFADRGGR
jgi:hypothetical protein